MAEQRKRHVYVTLEGPDDGGDFGRNTPGTRTGGIQEGFDYAHAHGRDMTIFGGRGGMHEGDLSSDNVYTLHETLRVPWSQDFRLDGGNYVMSYTGQTGDAVVIDSQMSCKYKFGLVVSRYTDGADVRIQPKGSGPVDFVTMVTTTFEFPAVVGSDVGILLDATYGNIQWCRILTEEVTIMVGWDRTRCPHSLGVCPAAAMREKSSFSSAAAVAMWENHRLSSEGVYRRVRSRNRGR